MRKPAIVYSLCKTSLVIHGAEWPHGLSHTVFLSEY
ncbi:Uncharacterised protein [Vibrio cholerae]|nr:Uncharacterised protein [Vibrio cholerae]